MNNFEPGDPDGYGRGPQQGYGGHPGYGSPQYQAPPQHYSAPGAPPPGYPAAIGTENRSASRGFVLPHVSYLGVAAAALSTLFTLLLPWLSDSTGGENVSSNAFGGHLNRLWPLLMVLGAVAALITTLTPVARRKRFVVAAVGMLLGASLLEFVYVDSTATTLDYFSLAFNGKGKGSVGLGVGAWLALPLTATAMICALRVPGDGE